MQWRRARSSALRAELTRLAAARLLPRRGVPQHGRGDTPGADRRTDACPPHPSTSHPSLHAPAQASWPLRPLSTNSEASSSTLGRGASGGEAALVANGGVLWRMPSRDAKARVQAAASHATLDGAAATAAAPLRPEPPLHRAGAGYRVDATDPTRPNPRAAPSVPRKKHAEAGRSKQAKKRARKETAGQALTMRSFFGSTGPGV